MNSPPQLVIFDCDGVLVDTEKMSTRVLKDELQRQGLNLSEADVNSKFRGRSLQDCFTMIEAELGRALPKDFHAHLDELSFSAYRKGLKAIAGVRGALEALKREGISVCVASSGTHEKMKLTLGLTGLLPFFQGALFSATQVNEGKPAPDLFCYAARMMGVTIEQSVVIEDSLAGATAGVRAGARVFAYTPLDELDHVEVRAAMVHLGAHPFSKMLELPALLSIAGVPISA